MSAPRDSRLSPRQLALKLATRQAVEAAGGQTFIGQEVGRAQSRLSDWCSENVPDFMPLDIAEKVEALGAGSPGHPHITRCLARMRGGALGHLSVDPAGGREELGDWLAVIASENADLVQVLAKENLSGAVHALPPAARRRIMVESQQLIAELEALVRVLGEERSDTS